MNKKHTKSTFDIDGIDAIKAITTSFIPSFLEITLKGLSALKALSAFNAANCEPSIPIMKNNKSIKEATTTKKSSRFQAFLM